MDSYAACAEVRQNGSHPQCWALQYAFSNTLKVGFFHMNIRSFYPWYILEEFHQNHYRHMITCNSHCSFSIFFLRQDQACRMVIFIFDEIKSDHSGRRARFYLLALRRLCLPSPHHDETQESWAAQVLSTMATVWKVCICALNSNPLIKIQENAKGTWLFLVLTA